MQKIKFVQIRKKATDEPMVLVSLKTSRVRSKSDINAIIIITWDLVTKINGGDWIKSFKMWDPR